MGFHLKLILFQAENTINDVFIYVSPFLIIMKIF